ncbi:hypothetical protein ONZ45_g3263 [Pleurotus djamor]|nr:hypothetical protein ONZ45_g3263 [Pleurotus djamor]
MKYPSFTATVNFSTTRGVFTDETDTFYFEVEKLVAFQPTPNTSVDELQQYEDDLRRAIDLGREIQLKAMKDKCRDVSDRFTETEVLRWEERLVQVKGMIKAFAQALALREAVLNPVTIKEEPLAPSATALSHTSTAKSVTFVSPPSPASTEPPTESARSTKRPHSDTDDDENENENDDEHSDYQDGPTRRANPARGARKSRKLTQLPVPFVEIPQVSESKCETEGDHDPTMPKLSRSNRTYTGIPPSVRESLPTGTVNPNEVKIEVVATEVATDETKGYEPARVGDKKWLGAARCGECVKTSVAICVGPGCVACFMCSQRKLSCSHNTKQPTGGRRTVKAKAEPAATSTARGRKREVPGKSADARPTGTLSVPSPQDISTHSEAELLATLVQILDTTASDDAKLKQETELHQIRLKNQIAMANAEYERSMSVSTTNHAYLSSQNSIAKANVLAKLSASMTRRLNSSESQVIPK